MNHKKLRRLYAEDRLQVRRRGGAMSCSLLRNGLHFVQLARPITTASGRDFAPRFLQTVSRDSALALHSFFTSIRLAQGTLTPRLPGMPGTQPAACGQA